MTKEEMNQVKLGFIGCGKHAVRAHALTTRAMTDLMTITAAYDPDKKALLQFCREYPGTRAAKTSEDVFEDKMVDAIVIATPHAFHFPLLQQGIEAGKHVLCEKPLWVGERAKGARDLLAKGTANKLVITSCHPRRFAPEYIYIHKHLPELQKQLGALLEFNFRFFYHKPPKGWKAEDSLLLDHLNHEIDLLNFLFGYHTLELTRWHDTNDHYMACGRRITGEVKICFLGTRRLTEKTYRNELELVFEKGRTTVVSTLTEGEVKTKITTASFGARKESSFHSRVYPYIFCFRKIMRNFCETILDRTTNYLTAEDLIINTDACNKLFEKGTFVYYPSR